MVRNAPSALAKSSGGFVGIIRRKKGKGGILLFPRNSHKELLNALVLISGWVMNDRRF